MEIKLNRLELIYCGDYTGGPKGSTVFAGEKGEMLILPYEVERDYRQRDPYRLVAIDADRYRQLKVLEEKRSTYTFPETTRLMCKRDGEWVFRVFGEAGETGCNYWMYKDELQDYEHVIEWSRFDVGDPDKYNGTIYDLGRESKYH